MMRKLILFLIIGVFLTIILCSGIARAEVDGCTNAYTYHTIESGDLNVSDGNVCINITDYDVNPTPDVYCGIWSDCVSGDTSADEYYVGYAGDGTAACSATDWQSAGTTQDIIEYYYISATEQVDWCHTLPYPGDYRGFEQNRRNYSSSSLNYFAISRLCYLDGSCNESSFGIAYLIGTTMYVEERLLDNTLVFNVSFGLDSETYLSDYEFIKGNHYVISVDSGSNGGVYLHRINNSGGYLGNVTVPVFTDGVGRVNNAKLASRILEDGVVVANGAKYEDGHYMFIIYDLDLNFISNQSYFNVIGQRSAISDLESNGRTYLLAYAPSYGGIVSRTKILNESGAILCDAGGSLGGFSSYSTVLDGDLNYHVFYGLGGGISVAIYNDSCGSTSVSFGVAGEYVSVVGRNPHGDFTAFIYNSTGGSIIYSGCNLTSCSSSFNVLRSGLSGASQLDSVMINENVSVMSYVSSGIGYYSVLYKDGQCIGGRDYDCDSRSTVCGSPECYNPLTVSADCPAVYPVSGSTVNVTVNFSVDSSVNMTMSAGVPDVGGYSGYSCDVSGSDTSFNFICNVPFEYYYSAGNYDAILNLTGTHDGYDFANSSFSSSVCTYNALLAAERSTDSVEFTGTYIGLSNISVDAPIQIYNVGNSEITNAALTAYDIPGTIIPSQMLLASYFRAGSDLSSSVQLEDGVEKDITFTLSPGEDSVLEFYLWLSAPDDLYPQSYIAVTPWQLILE